MCLNYIYRAYQPTVTLLSADRYIYLTLSATNAALKQYSAYNLEDNRDRTSKNIPSK